MFYFKKILPLWLFFGLFIIFQKIVRITSSVKIKNKNFKKLFLFQLSDFLFPSAIQFSRIFNFFPEIVLNLKILQNMEKWRKLRKLCSFWKNKIHIKKTASFHNFVSFHRLILPTILTDHFYDLLLWFRMERCRCYPPWGLTLTIRLIFYILSHENGFRPKISFYSVMM